MASIATFRQDMLDIVERRHSKRHPLMDAWANGELSVEQLGRWGVEHYHFTHDIQFVVDRILANCQQAEAREMELDNLAEEQEPRDPHNRQLLDFIEASGLPSAQLISRPLLPTTRALRDWLQLVSENRTWQEASAALHIGMEAQLAPICDRLVPALRQHYRFDEQAIRFFVTHQTADVEHGGRALDVVERHTPEELRPKVLQAIEEATEKRWFYFDGVYVKYVLGYNLGNQP